MPVELDANLGGQSTTLNACQTKMRQQRSSSSSLGISVRPPTVDDQEPIKQMQARSWLTAYPNDEHGIGYEWILKYTQSWFTPELMDFGREQIRKGAADPNVVALVAVKDTVIVGYLLGLRQHPKHGDGDLIALYCEPDLFGTGIGHTLMQEFLTQVGEAKARLDVAAYNQRAIKFYQRHGFKIVPGSNRLYRIRKDENDLIAGVNAIPTVDMIRAATTN